MSFDKVNYQNRRKDKQRGQGDKLRGKLVPKGEKVTFINSKGEEKELPNAEGGHLVRTKKGFQKMSRKEVRNAKQKSRAYTTSNYGYQHDKLGFSHTVNAHETKLSIPPSLSNHVRHRERQLNRLAIKQQAKEKVNG